MIKNSVYIPYLKRNITITAKDATELEEYAKLAGELRDSIPDSDCEKWHEWDGIVQACFETLDSLHTSRYRNVTEIRRRLVVRAMMINKPL